MTSAKTLLAAAAVTVVVAVGLSVALRYADDSGLERAGTVVLIAGLALAAILGVAGMLSLRRQRPHSGADDILP